MTSAAPNDDSRAVWLPEQPWVSTTTWSDSLPQWYWQVRKAFIHEADEVLEMVTASFRNAVLSNNGREERLARLLLLRLIARRIRGFHLMNPTEWLGSDAEAPEYVLFLTAQGRSAIERGADVARVHELAIAALKYAEAARDQHTDMMCGDWLFDYNLSIGAYDAAQRAADLVWRPPLPQWVPEALPPLNYCLLDIGRGDFDAVRRRLDELPPEAVKDTAVQDISRWVLVLSGEEAMPGLDLEAIRTNTDLRRQLLARSIHGPLYLSSGIHDLMWDLARKAGLDRVTGLLTADTLHDLFVKAFDAPPVEANAPALIVIRLEGLREAATLLDFVGYKECVTDAGRRLAETMPPGAALGRLMDHTFAALITADSQATEDIARQLADAMIRPLGTTQQVIPAARGVFASAGDGSPTDLWAAIDASLDTTPPGEMRRLGRDEVTSVARRSTLRCLLRQAELGRDLRLEWQPIVDARTGRAAAAEVLLRWNAENHGPIQPGEFLPLFDGEQMRRLELSLTLDALRKVRRLRRIDPRFWVQVNFSAASFSRPGLSAEITRLCRLTGVAPDALRIEITETDLLQLGGGAELSVAELRQAGVLCTLDDFGTGYSNLSYLSRLGEIDIKIDGAFVRELSENPRAELTCQLICAAAKELGSSVIAEHVETPQQAQRLLALGAVLHQGFLYSRSVSLEWMEKLLREPPASWAAHHVPVLTERYGS